MPLVPAICPQCGGKVEVNNEAEAAICKFCGTPFIVEKAINNYCITNNITAEVVNIIGEKDFVIRGGVLEKYNGESVDVVIPNNVIKIGESVFKGMPIKSIVISDSVTSIGKEAFSNCDILDTITIGNGITSIGNSGLFACTNLKAISVSDNNKYYSSVNGVLFNKNKTEILIYPQKRNEESYTIPNSVTSIGKCAFQGCTNLKNVTIPNSVISIEYKSFFGCSNIVNITIPCSVTRIGCSAFSNCTSLMNVNILNHTAKIDERAFENTQYERKEERKKKFVCQYCGGVFKGIFKKVCSKCGKPLDYDF